MSLERDRRRAGVVVEDGCNAGRPDAAVRDGAVGFDHEAKLLAGLDGGISADVDPDLARGLARGEPHLAGIGGVIRSGRRAGILGTPVEQLGRAVGLGNGHVEHGLPCAAIPLDDDRRRHEERPVVAGAVVVQNEVRDLQGLGIAGKSRAHRVVELHDHRLVRLFDAVACRAHLDGLGQDAGGKGHRALGISDIALRVRRSGQEPVIYGDGIRSGLGEGHIETKEPAEPGILDGRRGRDGNDAGHKNLRETINEKLTNY
nr:hypothetical protein [Roseivivax marinus]